MADEQRYPPSRHQGLVEDTDGGDWTRLDIEDRIDPALLGAS